ncbi:tim17 tim22 tim23 pmp24 family domain-containing [Ophiocordyceps camponoti-floridani]|uniref:Tim17 tim22 tim23 pmp24 family domain-containing n=1 Tax=Ophiocordyceps camponoti-floridani TaxID=2030778 RepID=A0A8H4Q257_9HYPO|nr:tim17 tim22 tim23 pmp24 family domain-containing [Ophiocordyceps camponoti-floridani]
MEPSWERQGRLAIPTTNRLLFGSLASGSVGFGLGAVQGARMAQLRFRAEHAHKMPDSTTGWYLYHKTKNYHAMFGGVREGLSMGVKTSFWTTLALGLENTVDGCRGASDMFSTIVATLTVAGAFSLYHKLTLSAATRTARMGLMFGLVYGGVQDVVGLARGRPIGYVDLIRRRLGFASRDADDQHR